MKEYAIGREINDIIKMLMMYTNSNKRQARTSNPLIERAITVIRFEKPILLHNCFKEIFYEF